jgi:phosphatidylglycerophosphatase A
MKPNLDGMKEQNNNLSNKVLRAYLSWFGAGRSPKAPGTVGTLAALPAIYAWSLLSTSHWINFSLIVLMTLAACWAADVIQKQDQSQDPQWIVIDEVIGIALTWAIVLPMTWIEWLLCFVSFRIFDIVKIWPASYFDKKVKNGAGTILDDVISGMFAGIFVYSIAHFLLRN